MTQIQRRWSPPDGHDSNEFLPAMPNEVESQAIAAYGGGVVGKARVQANAFIGQEALHCAGMLTQDAVSFATQLAELEGIAVQRAPWAAARIRAINDAFAVAAIQEITSVRRGV